MINKKASIRFSDKAHIIMNELVEERNTTVSAIINNLIENIDRNNNISTSMFTKDFADMQNLIGQVPDEELKRKMYQKMEVIQCHWLR